MGRANQCVRFVGGHDMVLVICMQFTTTLGGGVIYFGNVLAGIHLPKKLLPV